MLTQRSKWLIFLLLAIAQFMIVLDVSITNVALPTIKADLHFTNETLQWVVTAYALTFGGFLLFGGRAADLFGRRRMLLIGMTCFTIFSFLIGISQSAVLLIILRALQGLSAAFMSPAALSTVLVTFEEGPQRNQALGYWSLVAAGGAAVGLLLGGALTEYFGWRWDFFINVPVGIIIATSIYRIIPAREQEVENYHLDLPGAILVTTGLVTFVFAVSQAPIWGWMSAATIGTIIVSLLLIIAFIFNESKSPYPLMPLSIFKIRNIVGANLIIAPVAAGMFGMFFLISLYIQSILHFPPALTGLCFLPFPIILGFVSTRVPRFVSRYGFKPFLIAGPSLVAIAISLFLRLPAHGNYFTDVLPTLLIMPIGMGMTFMPIYAAATSGVAPQQSGLASGLINTSQQIGGAIGLAVLSEIAASITANNINNINDVVAGYHTAFAIAVLFIVFAIILALTVIQSPQKPHQTK